MNERVHIFWHPKIYSNEFFSCLDSRGCPDSWYDLIHLMWDNNGTIYRRRRTIYRNAIVYRNVTFHNCIFYWTHTAEGEEKNKSIHWTRETAVSRTNAIRLLLHLIELETPREDSRSADPVSKWRTWLGSWNGIFNCIIIIYKQKSFTRKKRWICVKRGLTWM